MIRKKLIALAAVAIFFSAAVLLLAGSARDQVCASGRDQATGVFYDFSAGAFARAGAPFVAVIRLDAADKADAAPRAVRLVHEKPGSAGPAAVNLRNLDSGGLWAGAVPAGEPGETASYYFVVEAGESGVFTVPAGDAGGKNQFRVAYTADVSPLLSGMSALAVYVPAVFLLHGLYFAVLFLIARFPDKSGARDAVRNAHLMATAALGLFSVAAIPLGLAVAEVSGLSRALPSLVPGIDAQTLRGAVAALLFACLLLSRTDLYKARANPRPLADRVHAALIVFAVVSIAAYKLLA